MNRDLFQLTVFGARGSMTASGTEYSVFGGATSCYLAEAGGESIFLDAGSGLIGAPTRFAGTPVILLSHLHLDHILGLGMYPRLAAKGLRTRLYMPAETGSQALNLLNGIYSPPYWPLSLTEYAGELEVEPLRLPFRIGEVLVEGIRGRHPGDSMIFRLSFGGKSLVYATDFEHDDESLSKLADFARNTDLLLYDGQYMNGEYEGHRGFGHSTAEVGIALKERSGARRLLLIHHDPGRKDRELLDAERRLGRTDIRFARQGERITL